jgi:hypothetical protein
MGSRASIFFTVVLATTLLDGSPPYQRPATIRRSHRHRAILGNGRIVATMRLKARSIDT